MAKINYLKDKNGEQVMPYTHERAVRDDNGTTLETKLQDRYTKTEVHNLITTPNQGYVTVPTFASLPAQGSADTIYRVSSYDGAQSQVDNTKYSEYAWNGTGYTFLCVKSQVGEVYDISTANSNTTYANLSAALGTNGANVPEALRKGGMSIKYVQSSDNKYVQARCMAQNFTTDVTQWQGVDDEPAAGSENLVKSGGVAKMIGYTPAFDFSISDERNNTILGLSGGELETKKFSSKNTPSMGYTFYDFAIGDENNNIILAIKDNYLLGVNLEINKVKRYRYLMTSFGYSAQKLSLLGTDDLYHFYMIEKEAFSVTENSKILRDPSPIQIGDYYYITYSNGWQSSSSPGVGKIHIIKTNDFISFEELEPLQIKDPQGESYGATQDWAPAWVRDNGFDKYIIVSVRQQSGFVPILFKYNPNEHSLGNAIIVNVPWPNTIDSHIYIIKGKYYILSKNETSKEIRIGVSDYLAGPYTDINSNISNYAPYEGQTLVRLDDGRLRMFLQDLSDSSVYQLKYSDADDIDGDWSEPLPILFDGDYSSYRLSHPDLIDFMKFGTGFYI